MIRRCAVLPFLFLAACGSRPEGEAAPAPAASLRLEEQSSGTRALLQAVSVVDARVVWISGHDATVVRTTDGGRSWQLRPVTGAPDSLQFRDIHALDANTAWILAAGPGDMSRIYRTTDGGASWTLQWTNPEPAGFFDCFDFWDANRGIAYGDAVAGELRVLLTDDGGRTWRFVTPSALPAAQAGEGGFAASGLCVDVAPGGHAWIAAGNAPRARVFRTNDYGATWTSADVPVVAGAASGLTAISMADDRRGFAFGGNLAVTDRRTDNVIVTTDGGRTWLLLAPVSFDGAIYGGLVDRASANVLYIVGPGGFAVSRDAGSSWTTIDDRPWWGLGSADPTATWIAGPDGRIARIRAGSGA